jgi:hypothetical protein
MNAVAAEPLFSKVLDYDGDTDGGFFSSEGPSRQEIVDIAAAAKSNDAKLSRWDQLA